MNADETFTQHLARLASLKSLRVGDRVVVTRSGRTGSLLRRCKPERDGWVVLWDAPVYGVTEGRVATTNLEREDPSFEG